MVFRKSNLNSHLERVDLSVNPEKPWAVAHTRARHEKKLCERLADREIRHYLPLAVNVSRASERVRHYENPLFPGYVFVSCHPEEKADVLRTSCVAAIIPVLDQEELTDQLRCIQTALRNAKAVRPCEYVTAGTRVRFVKGPMAGIEGMVVRRKGDFRLVMNVEIIRRTVEVEADIEDVEPVS
jgi:transcription antitermination factor NusG